MTSDAYVSGRAREHERATPTGPNAQPTHRASLEALGPLAVRIGQYLACRPDLVAERTIDELLTLVDQTTPLPWPTVNAIIGAAVGAPAEEVFESIVRSPVRPGVLTQTHHARLHDGTEVSVTVVRPDADAAIGSRSLDGLINQVSDICGIPEGERVNGAIESWLHEQLHLDRVYERASRLHRQQDRGFVFPAPHDRYSAGRVFTADRLRGIPFADLLPVAGRSEEYFRDLGLDRRALSDNLVECALEQVFSLGLFPAGLHPSALIALDDNEIGVVDLAFVDRIDSSVRDHYLTYVSSLRTGDVERIVDASQLLLGTPDVDRLVEFRVRLRDRAHELGRTIQLDGERGTSFDRHLRAAVRLSHDYGVTMMPLTISANSALLTADSVALRLDQGSGLGSVADRFFFRLQVRTVVGQLTPDNSQALALDVLDLLTTAPGNVARLLGELADDRFILRVASSESVVDRRAGNGRARLIATAIMLVAVAIVVTGPDVAGLSWVLRAVAYVALAALAAGFVALWVKLR